MMKAIVLLALVSVAFASMSMYAEVAGSTQNLYKWTKTEYRPHSSELITLGFAIKQKNLHKLEDTFNRVSDPNSADYGKHLTHAQLAEMIGAEDEVIQDIQKWLTNNNGQDVIVSNTRDYVWGTFNAGQVERLLSIELGVYSYKPSYSKNRALITRSEDAPLVPAHIAGNLDFVSGVWHFPAPEKLVKTKKDALKPVIDPFQPTWAAVGIPEGVLVEFIPVCSAGLNVTEDAYNPCSDYGNPITSLNYTFAQFDYNKGKVVTTTAIVTSKSPNWLNCTIIDSIFGAEVICTFNVSALDDSYVQLNSTFSYCFQDGSCTEPGQYMLPVVPSKYHGPQDVRQYYGIPDSLVASSKNSSQAVVEFIAQFFSPGDLAQFFKMFGLPAYSVYKVVGPNYPPGPGDEASLDIQYIMGVGQGVNSWFWSMTGNSWIMEWVQAVLNYPGAPKVHSISYGEDENSVSPAYFNRSEIELQKLGTLGHSILVSSGDEGTGQECELYAVSWPASSPSVTAVGATRITRGATPECQQNPSGSGCATIGEVSASADLGIFWTTGGGFSGYALRPSYQDAAVTAYLKGTNVPDTSYFNSTGRAYPDVVAVGHYLQVVDGGVVEPVDGTSASAPIFAGMIGLINDQRLKAGKETLGFLNNWLYSLDSSAFYDVTVGDTTFCDGDVCCDPPSFTATKGWDPASGLGSPRFAALLKSALALP